MSYFDELVARYKNMQYGGLSARNPSAIDNVLRTQQGLLGNSLQFGNANQTFMENIPTDEQQFIDTPTGRVAQNRFRMGPDGNPIFGVPGQLDADGSVGGAASYDSSIDYGDPGYAGVLPVDPVTGETTTQTTQRQGGGRDARDQGMTTANYNFVGNRFVGETLNEDGSIPIGIHGFLPGGLLAQAFTSPSRQLNSLRGLIDQNNARTASGLNTGAANQIAGLAYGVRQRAQNAGDVDTAVSAARIQSGYSGLSRDAAEAAEKAAREAAEAKEKETFNLGNFIGGLLGIGNQDGSNNTNGPGIGDVDSAADNAREQARDPNNANGGSGTTGGSTGGFSGGANPMGGGFTGGR